jgi:hypothetical protein
VSTVPHAKPMRWIFHIGAGKTGTSSIQFTLRDGQPQLRADGVWYLGLMLEHAPTKHFPWQVFGGTDSFHKLSQEEGERQLRIVIQDTVARAREAGVHTLIWSSESFFDRFDKALGPLHDLVNQGVDLQLVAYVRRHDAWARSAYVQWAIKHKTAKGPVLPFEEWVKNRPPVFAPTLNRYEANFPGRLIVRNLDQAGDAVGDFLQVTGLAHLGLTHVRDNVTPDNAEVLMRAVFNTGIREAALPMLFDRIIGRHTSFADTPDGYLAKLMPDSDDLQAVRQHCEDDRHQINQFLRAQGQDELADDMLTAKPAVVDSDRLLMALARLCVFQMKRLENLEGQIKTLMTAPPTND